MLERFNPGTRQIRTSTSTTDIKVGHRATLLQTLEEIKKTSSQVNADLKDVADALLKIKKTRDDAEIQKSIAEAAAKNPEDVVSFERAVEEIIKNGDRTPGKGSEATRSKFEAITGAATKYKQRETIRETSRLKIDTAIKEIVAAYGQKNANEDFWQADEIIASSVDDIYRCLHATYENGLDVFSEEEKAEICNKVGSGIFEKYCDIALEKDGDIAVDQIFDGSLLKKFLKDDTFDGLEHEGDFFTVSGAQGYICANRYIQKKLDANKASMDAAKASFAERSLARGLPFCVVNEAGKESAEAYWNTNGRMFFTSLLSKDEKEVTQPAAASATKLVKSFKYIPPSMATSIVNVLSSNNNAMAMAGFCALEELEAEDCFISPEAFSFYENLGTALFCKDLLNNATPIEEARERYKGFISNKGSQHEKLFKEFSKEEKQKLVNNVSRKIFGDIPDDEEYETKALEVIEKYYLQTGNVDVSVRAAAMALKNQYGYRRSELNNEAQPMRFPPSLFYGDLSEPDSFMRSRFMKYLSLHMDEDILHEKLFIESDSQTLKEIGRGEKKPTYGLVREDGVPAVDEYDIPIRLGAEAFDRLTPDEAASALELKQLEHEKQKLLASHIYSRALLEKFGVTGEIQAKKEPRSARSGKSSKRSSGK